MSRKLLTLFAILTFSIAGKAQWIDSMVVTPALPDANDTLKIYVYLSFPYGSCADVAYSSVVGNDIYGSALHCMGVAAFICYDVDTLIIPPVMAGTYNLYFTLSAGYGPPGNCTPGFQPDDVDTVQFQVSTVLDVPSLPATEVKLYPNPANNKFTVQTSAGTIERIEIFNVLGERVMQTMPMQSTCEIATESLAEGVYSCRIIDGEGRIIVRQVEILH